MELKIKNIRELYAALIKYTEQFFKEVIILFFLSFFLLEYHC